MRPRLTLPAFGSTLALLSLLACGGPYQGPALPAPDSAPNILTGTCRDYDVNARTMDVVTGVSFALRLITFKIHENTEIRIRGQRAELADLRANIVVRVEYRITPQGNLADKITVVLDATGMR
jgi:hypothetical protein